MSYIVIIALTVLSCLIFERLGLLTKVKTLTDSYRRQLAIIQDKTISDEERQKQMLAQSKQQLILLLTIIFYIILFISPFILYTVVASYTEWLKIEILYSLYGIIVSVIAVVLYILAKKIYGKL